MKNKILFGLLVFLSLSVSAQTPAADSLKKIINSGSSHDTLKMHAYYELAYEYLSINPDSALYFAETNLQKFGNNANRLLVSDAYAVMGTIYGYKRDFDKSLTNFQSSLELLKKLNNKSALAKTYFNIGLIYYYTSRFQQASEQYIEALKLLESIKDTKTLPTIYSGLAGVYKDMHSYGEAMRYYNKGLKMYVDNNDSVGLASIYNNIGTVLDYQGKLDEALVNYNKSIGIKEIIHYERGMPSTLNNIGIILSKKGQYDEALTYYNKALGYSVPAGDKLSQAVSYDGIGMVYYQKKNYLLALSFLEKTVALGKETDSKIDLISAYEKMALCYAGMGNYVKAYTIQHDLLALKDSVLNEENTKQINEMSAKYESEKKELEISLLNKDAALKQEEINKKDREVQQQLTRTIFFAVALLLVSVLAFFIFRGYRLKKQSNEIITAQKQEVELQRDLIETKNKEITDSIFYARRIQRALLASDSLLGKYLPEYFVLHKPKDIVSGDFYWANVSSDRFYLSVADCTGHGVPGAFMSLLNISFLNEALIEKKIESPEKVLEQVRAQIISSLNPEGVEVETKDGMDAVLCMFDFKGMWLRFACANNPLWLIRNKELKEFAADKMPVGMHHGEQKPFTLQTLGLRKGDLIYLFTDGYADQFGGSRGKKFKYKQLQTLLLEISEKPMEEQQRILDETLELWRGKLEQVDDVLIIGIRI